MDKYYLIMRIRSFLSSHPESQSLDLISENIASHNTAPADGAINRHTLATLRDGTVDDIKRLRLSVAQLLALDLYMYETERKYLFERTDNLFHSIADSQRIDFIVSARLYDGAPTYTVSAWDMRALKALLTTRLSRSDIHLIEVSDRAPMSQDVIESPLGAILAIGSPIANDASDMLFNSMLDRGADPIRKRTRIDEVPFFITSQDEFDAKINSGFIRHPSFALTKGAKRADEIKDGFRALVIDDMTFPCDAKTDYAMLVAQRHPKANHIRAVLCGLSGMGTNELAEILLSDTSIPDVPEHSRGIAHPPISVAVYELELEGRITVDRRSRRKIPRKRDNRTVVQSKVACEPMVFHHFERNGDGIWERNRPQH